MSGEHKIRWRESDEQELKRLVKNYNAKIKYTADKIKKSGKDEQINALPAKLSVKALKKNITTRKELNKILKEVSDFSKRGMEKVITNAQGEKATLFEIKKAEANAKELNRKRAKEQKKLDERPVVIDGQPRQDVTRMAKQQTLKPVSLTFEKMKPGEFKKFSIYVERQISGNSDMVKAKAYFENLIQSWYNNLSSDNAKKLESKARQLGVEKILKLYYAGFEEVAVSYSYDPTEEADKVESIENALDSI